MKDQTEVCPLSRGGIPPICPITEQRSLAPSSWTRISIGSSHKLLSLMGEIRAYHVPVLCPDGLGPACSPVRLLVYDEGNWIPSYLLTYLLVQASQHLWLVRLNDVYQRFT